MHDARYGMLNFRGLDLDGKITMYLEIKVSLET